MSVKFSSETQDVKNAWKQLFKRSWLDEPFKRYLISNPKSALKEFEGENKYFSIAPDVEVVVLEETPHRQYIILPMNPVLDVDLGISPDDLEDLEMHCKRRSSQSCDDDEAVTELWGISERVIQ